MPKKSTLNQYKYDSTHCRTFRMKLNLSTDADIIKKLESVPSMQGYLKQLVRKDINSTPAPKTKEEKPMKSWYIIDDLNPTPINAKSEEEAARIMRETWLALSEHDRKERESYYVALCSQDEDGCVDLESEECSHSITDADQVMLAHYNTIIDEMTDRYRSVLESDGVCQYQVYIWEDGEIECLCGPNGDNTWLAPNRGEHRKLYYVTTVDAPYVDTYNLSGADPEECSKEETIDFLVDGYREEAEARLDAAIEEASER